MNPEPLELPLPPPREHIPPPPIRPHFTLQPGGARLEAAGAAWERGIRLVFPNAARHRPGTRIDFWSYDSKAVGWFRYEKTDLAVADVIPIALTRTYRPNDPVSRPFGIGATHGYELHVVGDKVSYSWAEVVLPDGGRIRDDRTSAGTGVTDAVMEHTATPTRFFKSVLAWNPTHAGWDLTLTDGTVYEFFVDFTPEVVVLRAVQDRYGNRLVIVRDANRRVTQVRSPHGRTLDVTYDGSDRITEIQDNIGRTVEYTYDGSGRLWKVTDARGGVTELTYDVSHRLETITDARGIVYLTNEYDGNGRVSRQELADGGEYTFAYTLDVHGRVEQTDVTNPRGVTRRVTFNAYGYALTDTRAHGEPEAQTTTYVRASPSNRVTRPERRAEGAPRANGAGPLGAPRVSA